MLYHIHAYLLINDFPPNIIHAKYKTFTLSHRDKTEGIFNKQKSCMVRLDWLQCIIKLQDVYFMSLLECSIYFNKDQQKKMSLFSLTLCLRYGKKKFINDIFEVFKYCNICEFEWFPTNVFSPPESEYGWTDLSDQYV